MTSKPVNLRDLNIRPDTKKVLLNSKAYGRPRTRPCNDPVLVGYIEAFEKFEPGDSFFVPGVTPRQMNFLRSLFVRAGMNLVMRNMPNDPIYGVQGVRIWRLAGRLDAL